MTYTESFEAIRVRWAAAEGLRRHQRCLDYAARLDLERKVLVHRLGLPLVVVSRHTGIPIQALRA